MNKQTHFLLKTGLVTALMLIGVSVPVNATPLFPKTLPSTSTSLVGISLVDSVAGDFNGDGAIDLAVVLNGVSGTTPGGVIIFSGDGNGYFSVSGSFAAGNQTFSVARGDFNADGNIDMVLANISDNTVSVELGDGSGGFTEASGSPLTVGNTPSHVVIADFNADNREDIAVTSAVNNSLSILLGDGSGGFSATVGSPATGQFPSAMVAADVNADGKVDILVANKNAGTVSVLLGDGAGGFTPGATLPAGNKPQKLVLADFNADGKQDLAIANSGSSSVSVLLGDGAGGFNFTGSFYTVGVAPIDIEVADINGDGKLDIATANFTDNNISVLLGNGSGGFTAVINTTSSGSPTSITLRDFDNDGRMDISVTNGIGQTSVLWGKGTGQFYSAVKYFSVTDKPSSIAVGDVNNDGSPDLVVASSPATGGNINVLANSGSGDFSNILPAATVGTISALSTVALADLVGDTNLDLAVTNSNDNVVAVLKGNGAGSFTPVAGSPFSVGTMPLALAIGDMDNDGKADLVVANKGSDNVSVLLNTGSDSFSAATSWFVGTSPASVALIDQDTDGNLDMLITNQGSDNLALRRGTGSGGFTALISASAVVGSAPVSMVFGKLDSDALPDRIVVNKGKNALDILLGTAGSSFSLQVDSYPDSAVIGDFNGDSKPDIAVLTLGLPPLTLCGGGCVSDSALYIFLGDGNGAFSLAPHFPFIINKNGSAEADLVTADFNNDGFADLALVNDVSAVVQVLLNLDPRPTAKTDTVTINQNTSVTTGNVLSNDVDANQTGSLTITAVNTSSANGGSVTDNGDNTFTYLPPAGFTGTDSFNYTITDGWTKTASGKVSVTVNAVAAPSGGGGGGGSLNLYLLLLLSVLFFLRYIKINFGLGYLHRKCLRQL